MTETPPERGGGGGGFLARKYGPLPVWGWGVVFTGGALVYFWWRSRSAGGASSSISSTTSSSASTAAELAALQNELDQLMSDQGSTGTGSGTGGGTGGGSGGGSGDGGGSTKTTGGTGGGGGTGTKPKPGTPGDIRATKVTATSVTIAWNKSANATSYRVRVTYQDKAVRQASVTATTATISGLTPDHTYTFHVAAVGPGGTSAESNGPAVKTARGATATPQKAAS